MSILELTMAGGIMALVVTVLRAVLLNRLPKKTFVFLWEIVMLRLILPIRIPSVTSVYTIFSLLGREEGATDAVPKTAVMSNPVITNVLTDGAFQAAETPLGESVQTGASIPVWTIVWLVGMAITFALFAVGYAMVYRRYRYAETIKEGLAAEWLPRHKIRRNVRLLRCEQAVSPLTYGIICPAIILPAGIESDDPKRLNYILTHEMTHILRFDMLRKIIAAAVLCIHWFDPMVWVMYLLYNRDIELACDEAVVRKMSGDCRSDYAMALISMEECQRGFSSLYSHFSKNCIQERIVAIMKTKKTGIISTLTACALVLGVTCVFATTAAAEEISGSGLMIIDSLRISNGEKHYSFDDGKSFLKQEDVDIHVQNVEWWTYDEYKAWLDNEKIELQKMLGEKAWTGGRGDFIWTQELIDETIAMYEDILEQIKNGVKVSKSINGDENTVLMQSVPIGKTSEMSGDELNVIAGMSREDTLKKFGKYGISFDENDKMLYNGEAVRFFCDGCEIDGCWAVNSGFYDENGKIDVYTVYEATANGDGSYDPMGKLVGLRKATSEEFKSVNFSFAAVNEVTVVSEDTVMPSTFDIEKNSFAISIDDETTETILSGGDVNEGYYVSTEKSDAEGNSTVTGTTFESIFAKYRKYGIEYKAVPGGLGNIYFNGELVKRFYDVTEKGAFSFESTDGGSIIVSAVYDDNGELVGVKKAS